VLLSERSPADTPDSYDLASSYAHCRAMAREHAKSFYLASRFLDADRRRAIWAVYAFCRTADDIVDGAGSADARMAALDNWERGLIDAYRGVARDPIFAALVDAAERFTIPIAPALDLLRGARMDVVPHTYATFADLREYCYLVASTVGLLTIPVLGTLTADAADYGVTLGLAMQLTNILRDVGEDSRMGRVYLPVDELARHGLDAAAIHAGRVDDAFIAFMREQIARAHTLYDEAEPGIELLAPSSRGTVRAAARLYRGILGRIEANGYDVFTRRAYVPWPNKVVTALRAVR
jgi:phytoene synthase